MINSRYTDEALVPYFPSFLNGAIRALRTSTGFSDVEKRMTRVSMDREVRLQIELADLALVHWYQWDGVELRAQRPENDEKLPFTSKRSGQLENATILSYRPGRRLVITDTCDGTRVVIKAYRPRAYAAAIRGYKMAALISEQTELLVPKIIHQDEESAYITMSYLSGRSIDLSSEDQHYYFELGHALRQMQELSLDDALPVHTYEDEFKVLDQLAERVRRSTGTLPADWVHYRSELEGLMGVVPTADFVLCHRDLYDKQVLAIEQSVGLLDFDSLCLADGCLDAANFLTHLTLRSLQEKSISDQQIRACGQAFLDGFSQKGEEGFWPRLRFFQASTFLRLSLLYWLRPRHRHVCKNCLTIARRCMKDVRETGIKKCAS